MRDAHLIDMAVGLRLSSLNTRILANDLDVLAEQVDIQH